jgi:SAM-dependent methyltransferase
VIDTTGFTDKDSKRPEYRELYEKHDFITAYAKHTDMRIAKDGPELAIGAKRDGQQDWDKHGKMQLEFLIDRGLKPHNFLLDFGCGTGRLAVKAVPYLDSHRYVGVDISARAIESCLAHNLEKGACFAPSLDGRLPQTGWPRDFIWSHSVITHLPPDVVHQLFSDLATLEFGQFFFTYKEAKQTQRSGLKQFQYPKAWLANTAKLYGLKAEADPMEWPAGQKTMVVRRA